MENHSKRKETGLLRSQTFGNEVVVTRPGRESDLWFWGEKTEGRKWKKAVMDTDLPCDQLQKEDFNSFACFLFLVMCMCACVCWFLFIIHFLPLSSSYPCAFIQVVGGYVCNTVFREQKSQRYRDYIWGAVWIQRLGLSVSSFGGKGENAFPCKASFVLIGAKAELWCCYVEVQLCIKWCVWKLSGQRCRACLSPRGSVFSPHLLFLYSLELSFPSLEANYLLVVNSSSSQFSPFKWLMWFLSPGWTLI